MLDYLDSESQRIAGRLGDFAQFVTSSSPYNPSEAARRLRTCGNWLAFNHYYTVDQVRLARASFCKEHLLCPLCAIRRGARTLQRYVERFEAVRRQRPELHAQMVTLTVKNGELLGERMRHLREAVQRLHRRRLEKRQRSALATVRAAVWSYEVTNIGNGWHPHVHAVYLSEEPLSQEGLSEEWLAITGDSHIVDVRPFAVGQDPAEAFCEVFKYAVKFGDLSPELRFHAFMLLRGERLLASLGAFRGIEIPEDLTDEPLEGLAYVELFYRYLPGAGYSLSESPRATA